MVGIPDSIAGEIPVAIVSVPKNHTQELQTLKTQILQASSALGPKYSLGGVYTLEDLDLTNFPMTRTGKIRKDELKAAILCTACQESSQERGMLHMASSECSDTLVTPPQSPYGSEEDDSSEAWSDAHEPVTPPPALTQKRPDELSKASYLVADLSAIVIDILGTVPPPEADLRGFMDSVSMLRYTDRVQRRLGRKLYLQDVLKHATLAEHAALIESRGMLQQTTPSAALLEAPSSSAKGLGGSSSMASLLQYEGNKIPTDASFAFGFDTPLATASPALQEAATRTLKKLHLSPTDVEAIYPIRASYHGFITAQRRQTYRHRMCFDVTIPTTPSTIHAALEAALATRPVLRTILVRVPDEGTNIAYHLAIRAPAILPHIIAQPSTVVHSAAELESIQRDDRAEAFHPLLTTQAQIITVRSSSTSTATTDTNENDTHHLLLTHSHAVFDLLSIRPFHQDLATLLLHHHHHDASIPPPPLITPTPYTLFTEIHTAYAPSPRGLAAARAAAHRLRGISAIPAALFPPQRARGMMIGRDAAGNKTTRLVHLPGMVALQQQQQQQAPLHPSHIAIAALTLLNTQRTKQPHAIFTTVSAGRGRWPSFVPAAVAAVLPALASVDGPLCEGVLQRICVDHHRGEDERVGEFLQRVRGEQEAIERDGVHVPWEGVLGALGAEEAGFVAGARGRQTFVWDVSLRMGEEEEEDGVLRLVARYDWPDG